MPVPVLRPLRQHQDGLLFGDENRGCFRIRQMQVEVG